jgi:hypothetical protein
MMTKKDFRLIADTIAALPRITSRESVTAQFASALKQTNSQFDSEKFSRWVDEHVEYESEYMDYGSST